MALLDVFNSMDEADRPKIEMSDSGVWWQVVDGLGKVLLSESLAESAICWAMVKALARSESGCEISVEEGVWHALAVAGGVWAYGKSPEPDALTALHAAYRAMKEAR